MSIRKEIYNNKIIIDSEKISLKTDIKYKAIDIVFKESIGIERLLPTDYLIMKKNVPPSSCRVVIVKVNNNEEIFTQQFSRNNSNNKFYNCFYTLRKCRIVVTV